MSSRMTKLLWFMQRLLEINTGVKLVGGTYKHSNLLTQVQSKKLAGVSLRLQKHQ